MRSLIGEALVFLALAAAGAVWPASALAQQLSAEEIVRRAIEYRESIESGRGRAVMESKGESFGASGEPKREEFTFSFSFKGESCLSHTDGAGGSQELYVWTEDSWICWYGRGQVIVAPRPAHVDKFGPLLSYREWLEPALFTLEEWLEAQESGVIETAVTREEDGTYRLVTSEREGDAVNEYVTWIDPERDFAIVREETSRSGVKTMEVERQLERRGGRWALTGFEYRRYHEGTREPSGVLRVEFRELQLNCPVDDAAFTLAGLDLPADTWVQDSRTGTNFRLGAAQELAPPTLEPESTEPVVPDAPGSAPAQNAQNPSVETAAGRPGDEREGAPGAAVEESGGGGGPGPEQRSHWLLAAVVVVVVGVLLLLAALRIRRGRKGRGEGGRGSG